MIGRQLDKYEIQRKIGEGGMATVYSGRHLTLDREVAIKVLHPHLSSSTRNRKRFAREARAIEHLKHPNILDIFDYSGIDSKECYIITEFVDGPTLTELLENRGRLPSELVALIGLQLCDALAFAHDCGILHRDLKPENVMIRRSDGVVKLMDFGIARFLDESQVTLTGALVGSPAFMSPEQAMEAPLDPRSDLFSLGTVIFNLITGQVPFRGSNPSVILKNVIEGERPHISELAPDVSPGIADVVERLMGTAPDARFPTASAAADALKAALDEVQFDREGFSVLQYLDDPDGYEARHSAFVAVRTLELGKAMIGNGDALGALRLFNRLLAIDENNEEVLAHIQSLHAEPEAVRAEQTRTGWALGAALLAVVGVMAVAWWAATSVPAPLPVPQPAPESPVPLPVSPVPAPDSEPAPAPVLVPEPAPTGQPTPRPPEPVVAPAPSLALPPPEPPSVPAGEGEGTLQLKSRLPADVYHNGKRIGSTRRPITLQAGTYRLEVRSNVIVPRMIRVEIGPDEVVEREVSVETRPASIRLDSSFPAGCTVSVDGQALGTLQDVGHTIEIASPEQVGHRLQLDCPGRPIFEHIWRGVVLPNQVLRP